MASQAHAMWPDPSASALVKGKAQWLPRPCGSSLPVPRCAGQPCDAPSVCAPPPLPAAGEAVPLDYDAFPVPLPPGAVRLGVIFFQVRRGPAVESPAVGLATDGLGSGPGRCCCRSPVPRIQSASRHGPLQGRWPEFPAGQPPPRPRFLPLAPMPRRRRRSATSRWRSWCGRRRKRSWQRCPRVRSWPCPALGAAAAVAAGGRREITNPSSTGAAGCHVIPALHSLLAKPAAPTTHLLCCSSRSTGQQAPRRTPTSPPTTTSPST
jgi:hypothetical protein